MVCNSDSALIAGGVRQVFQRCTEGSNALSTRKQDLEIRSVTISEDNVAYFAIGVRAKLASIIKNQSCSP